MSRGVLLRRSSRSTCSILRRKGSNAPTGARPRFALAGGARRACDPHAFTPLRTHTALTPRAQFKVYSAVPEGDDGADMADLKASLGDAVVKIGMGAAMKNKWLRKEGTVLKRALAGVVDEVQAQLREIQLAGGAEGVLPSDVLQNLIKRKMVRRVARARRSLSEQPFLRARRRHMMHTRERGRAPHLSREPEETRVNPHGSMRSRMPVARALRALSDVTESRAERREHARAPGFSQRAPRGRD